jgi:two-component system OmpR family sensor kinase
VSRVPIRVRLTLAFALAMTVVLAATGAFLYVRLGSSLDEAIDENLQARASELAPRVARGTSGLPEIVGDNVVDPEERFVQVLGLDGRSIAATSQLGQAPLLDREVVARAAELPSTWLELDDVPGIAGHARVLAHPVETSRGRVLLLVGIALEDRDDAVRGFVAELLLVGPTALVLVSLLGYALATAALRPVESMRREAAVISASEPGRRLPLPNSHDEVRRLGETLNEVLERLESALERERRFVADASHELRTPLALLQTELELALRRPRTELELERALRSAAAETDRVVRLAEDLLVLARSDRGQLALRSGGVAAEDVLRGVARRFAQRARAADRAVEVEVPAEGLGVQADRARLEQALGNLLDNALQHAHGAIHLVAAERNGLVELHVLDEGPGFPPGLLPHAFDRFSRGDQARAGNGAGLGLAIADAIARAHGGSSHAANREEGGADVWLSIPSRNANARRR